MQGSILRDVKTGYWFACVTVSGQLFRFGHSLHRIDAEDALSDASPDDFKVVPRNTKQVNTNHLNVSLTGGATDKEKHRALSMAAKNRIQGERMQARRKGNQPQPSRKGKTGAELIREKMSAVDELLSIQKPRQL